MMMHSNILQSELRDLYIKSDPNSTYIEKLVNVCGSKRNNQE